MFLLLSMVSKVAFAGHLPDLKGIFESLTQQMDALRLPSSGRLRLPTVLRGRTGLTKPRPEATTAAKQASGASHLGLAMILATRSLQGRRSPPA